MEKLLASLVLVLAPAFGDDPYHLLPDKSVKPVTIHATMNAYDAVFAVARIIGADVFYAADLKSITFRLDLVKVDASKAFDIIAANASKRWQARPSSYNPGRVLVFVNDLSPELPPYRRP